MIFPIKDPVYLACLLSLIIEFSPIIANFFKISHLVVLIILGTIFGDNVLEILTRNEQLILLEKIGLLYIMLLAGLQMNLSNLRQLGMRSLVFGLLTFGIPLLIGISFGNLMTYSFLTSLLLGLLYSPHTLISYPIILKLGISQKESMSVAVGGTIITSVLTLTGLSVVQALVNNKLELWLWIKLLILLPILIIGLFWIIVRIGNIVLKNNQTYLINQYIFVLICLYVSASATSLLGVDSIVGAFLAGLALNSIVSDNNFLMKQIEFFGSNLLIPCFLISVGVLCNPRILLTHPENLGIALAVIIGAVGTKWLAAWLAGQIFKFSWAEVMVIFSLTMSRAALVLVIALFGRNAGLLNEEIFNAVIFYIIVTCLASPLITDIFGRQIR